MSRMMSQARFGKANGSAKISDDAVLGIIRCHMAGWTRSQIGTQFRISPSQVGRIIRGENRQWWVVAKRAMLARQARLERKAARKPAGGVE